MDKNREDLSRRKFVKGAAATGVAATGIGAFGGQAASQQENLFDLDNVTATETQEGLVVVDLTLTNVNVDVIDDVRVNVRDVRVIRDITLDDVVKDITVTLEDINAQALNNLNVVVQALSSGGAVLETERQRVENVQ